MLATPGSGLPPPPPPSRPWTSGSREPCAAAQEEGGSTLPELRPSTACPAQSQEAVNELVFLESPLGEWWGSGRVLRWLG